jgi:class 3 adenylate cyclase/tetratricopeptide (TPR) repeat protein
MSGDLDAILTRLARPGAKATELLPLYQTVDHAASWRTSSSLYRAFARKLISQGHPTQAFELAREGLAAHPDDQELQYLLALAMARGRNIAGAEGYLAPLLGAAHLEQPLRVEALALQGRLFKDRFERASDPTQKARHAAQAAERYLQAAELSGADPFPLTNAATMSLLAGNAQQAQALAQRVIDRGLRDPEQPGRAADYWALANLGEAYFLLGDLAEAAVWYVKAVAAARAHQALGDIAAMRRNAHLIREKLQVSDELLRLFYVGSVVVFAGHMIDHPQRGTRDGLPSRFPADPQLIRDVSAAIQAELDKLNVTIGVSSVACGSDILFAEHVLARNAELHVVLPYERTDFYTTSVDFGLSGKEWKQWRRRCDAVLERATEVHYATPERYLGDEVLVELNSEFVQGLAILRAAQRMVMPHVLAVCDPASPKRKGGTAHFLELWARKGLPISAIDLAELREKVLGPTGPPGQPQPQPAPAQGERAARELKSMLFADVKNFSALMDPSLPQFFDRFLGGVNEVIRSLPSQPVASNTWGDGLYLVFDRPSDCAEAALRLLESSQRMPWEDLGLGPSSPLRIGIHTGPVYPVRDPIIERLTYFGSQVTRAARIEPVTMPGCVFASEQFAALLMVESGGDYVCDYIGVEQLAKDYDRCVLYRLGRREG